jgi:hypothetical protein
MRAGAPYGRLVYRMLGTVAVSTTLGALSVGTIVSAASAAPGSPSCTHFAAKGSAKGATTLSFICAYGAKSAGYYRPSVLTVVTGLDDHVPVHVWRRQVRLHLADDPPAFERDDLVVWPRHEREDHVRACGEAGRGCLQPCDRRLLS